MMIATNLSQQEIGIDFMMSSHCFWHFIWLLIVTDIHFIVSNIWRQNAFEIKVHASAKMLSVKMRSLVVMPLNRETITS